MNEMRKLMETIKRINEEEPCSICKGQGRSWDPYATYEGGAYRDCEACRGTGDESVRLGELDDDLDEVNGVLPDRTEPGFENVDEPTDGDTAEWEYWAGGISPG